MVFKIVGVEITNRFLIWMGFLIILLLLGLNGFGYTLLQGHYWTGLEVPSLGGSTWGLYVVNYIFLIGASAGGFIIAASAHIFNVEKYKRIATIATMLALVTILLPPLFIAADLGRPDRMLHIIFPTPNFKSPLLFVGLTLSLYILLLVLELWFSMRRRLVKTKNWLALGFTDLSEMALHRDEVVLKILSLIGLPLAVSVHSVTGFIFGLIKSRPIWLSPLMAPIFLSSALVSGLALLILVCILVRRFAGIKIEQEILSDLAKLMFMIIPIDLFMLGIEVLTVGYAHEPAHMPSLMFILTGANAPLFWFEVMIGGMVPFVILAFRKYRSSTYVLTLMSTLIILGIWLKRLNLLEMGTLFTHDWFGVFTYPEGSYFPSLVEWSVMAGIYGFAAILFTLALKFLPLMGQTSSMKHISEQESE